MNKYLIIFAIWIATVAGAFLFGKFKSKTTTAPQEIKEVIKVDKQMEKVIEYIELPSGEKRTRIVEKEVLKTQTLTETKKIKPSYMFTLSKNVTNSDPISVGVYKRVMWDIYGGAIITPGKPVLLSIGATF
jgi:hypothetical protein